MSHGLCGFWLIGQCCKMASSFYLKNWLQTSPIPSQKGKLNKKEKLCIDWWCMLFLELFFIIFFVFLFLFVITRPSIISAYVFVLTFAESWGRRGVIAALSVENFCVKSVILTLILSYLLIYSFIYPFVHAFVFIIAVTFNQWKIWWLIFFLFDMIFISRSHITSL